MHDVPTACSNTQPHTHTHAIEWAYRCVECSSAARHQCGGAPAERCRSAAIVSAAGAKSRNVGIIAANLRGPLPREADSSARRVPKGRPLTHTAGPCCPMARARKPDGERQLWAQRNMGSVPRCPKAIARWQAYHNAAASRPAGSPPPPLAQLWAARDGVRPAHPCVGPDRSRPPICADLQSGTLGSPHGSVCRTGPHRKGRLAMPDRCIGGRTLCRSIAIGGPTAALSSSAALCCTAFVCCCHAVQSSAARCPLQRCAVNVVR